MINMSKSIAQIKEEFGKADEKEREALYSMYDADARSGVQKLIASYRKKEEALRLERERLSLMKSYERKYKDAEMIAESMKREEDRWQGRFVQARLFCRKIVKSYI